MWNNGNYNEFLDIVGDLLEHEDVQSMRDLPQHSKLSNCLDHSIYVSYLSFLMARKMGCDYVAAARGGLLHDLYLCKWEETDLGISRLWKHPKLALKNAKKRFDISDVEADIIVKHMWPLTFLPPKYKESFIVTMADKVCAVSEMCRIYSLFKVKKHLSRRQTA